MEAITSNGDEYHIITEAMDDPQYLVTEADDLHDSHQEDGNDSEEGIDQIRDQDRFLPIANVAKIMKGSIPDNAKIAKDAKECVQMRFGVRFVRDFGSFGSLSSGEEENHQWRRSPLCHVNSRFRLLRRALEDLPVQVQRFRQSR